MLSSALFWDIFSSYFVQLCLIQGLIRMQPRPFVNAFIRDLFFRRSLQYCCYLWNFLIVISDHKPGNAREKVYLKAYPEDEKTVINAEVGFPFLLSPFFLWWCHYWIWLSILSQGVPKRRAKSLLLCFTNLWVNCDEPWVRSNEYKFWKFPDIPLCFVELTFDGKRTFIPRILRQSHLEWTLGWIARNLELLENLVLRLACTSSCKFLFDLLQVPQ